MVATTTEAGTKTTWAIDAAHSTAEFAVKHMMFSTVKGHFSGINGTITLDEQNLANSSVEVTIDASSVNTRDEKRDAHLRSADFFDAEQYPTMTFASTRVEAKKNDHFTVYGDLTIHGVTQPVALDASFNGKGVNPWGQEVAGFSAETKISRKSFGLTWNVGLEAGGVLVGDDIKISIEVEAAKQS
jgi:polyisoprenoid-binding protein YceI